jgi:hypothetical protein
MSISKQSVFDPASTDFTEEDTIGSYLISKSGALIDSTDVGGKDGLNVNVLNDIAVDLSHTEDSIQLGDGTNLLTSENVGADYALHTYLLNTSLAVTATQLDIDDLEFGTDSVTAHQGGTWTIDSITNDVNIADGGNSITVDAVALDIRPLLFGTDSVDVSGSSIETEKVGYGACSNPAAVPVTAVATQLSASPLASRDYILVQNDGQSPIYIGDSGVTAAKGIKVSKGGSIELEVTSGCDLYAICDATKTATVRILELAA